MKKHQAYNARLRFLTVLLLSLLYTAIVPLAAADQPCHLTIGWDPWAPYQYIDHNGTLIGLDVELVSSTVKHMGCVLEYQEMPWKRLLVSIKNGHIDLAAGATVTEDRKQWSYTSQSYRKDEISLFMLKEEVDKYPYTSITTLLENTNIRIGMLRGAYLGKEIKKLSDDPKTKNNFQFVTMDSQNPRKLIAKYIDGYLANRVAGRQYLRETNDLNEIEIHPMHVFSSTTHLLFSKKTTTPELVERFNKSLLTLQTNGSHQKIISKYLE
ncbi:hypothetical protein A9Q99_12100 [Gammaproteobacteria bacterium 45_16_T64]|nr:hypothetical protein A9Q99_12100 [Gammaproteobacteria bacterium 45_16_T64]